MKKPISIEGYNSYKYDDYYSKDYNMVLEVEVYETKDRKEASNFTKESYNYYTHENRNICSNIVVKIINNNTWESFYCNGRLRTTATYTIEKQGIIYNLELSQFDNTYDDPEFIKYLNQVEKSLTFTE